MTDLIADLEAGPGSRELSDRVLLAMGWTKGCAVDGADQFISPDGSEEYDWFDDTRPDVACSVDDALALVPVTAIQKALISHISSREDVDEVWSFRFMDTAQTMGERAAKEQIKRLHISSEGAAYEVLEKAIADHYLEFFSYDCIEPACAICIAILRAKHGQD